MGIMSASKDFWVKDDLWVPVEKDHLSPILDNPQQFGLTRERIESVYGTHNQEIGAEGPARDTIVKEATENGWLRVRRFNNIGSHFVVQGTKLDEQIESIPRFVEELFSHVSPESDATIVLSDLASAQSRSFHVGSSGITSDIEGELTSE